KGMQAGGAVYRTFGQKALYVQWTLADQSRLALYANLGPAGETLEESPAGARIYQSPGMGSQDGAVTELKPWSVLWLLSPSAQG
ncbi:MAG: DUF3459 domain-containing protein, partial [Nitrospinota bacterium]|nr:DUF3459 domain-containing protein [Nitrospinota bacterium]